MFGDYVKMGAKALALVSGVALIITIFNNVYIPNLDLSVVRDYINKAYTIGVNLVPWFPTLWGMGVALLNLNVVAYGIKFGLIGVKWVLKVNE